MFRLQVRTTAQLEVTDISAANQVMGCWSAQIGCLGAIGPIGEQTCLPLFMLLSCEENSPLGGGGRTASHGVAETGKLETVWERKASPQSSSSSSPHSFATGSHAALTLQPAEENHTNCIHREQLREPMVKRRFNKMQKCFE